MPIEPPEIPPTTPGRPLEPPPEDPVGNPNPEVPAPVQEPDAPAPAREVPGDQPEEVPGHGPLGPTIPNPATD